MDGRDLDGRWGERRPRGCEGGVGRTGEREREQGARLEHYFSIYGIEIRTSTLPYVIFVPSRAAQHAEMATYVQPEVPVRASTGSKNSKPSRGRTEQKNCAFR
jgi:hypothetical protein